MKILYFLLQFEKEKVLVKEIYTLVSDSLDTLKAELKATEAAEWKEETKREADSLAEVFKEQKKHKDSLKLKGVFEKDSLQIDYKLLEKSIKEIENLIEPISDKVSQ